MSTFRCLPFDRLRFDCLRYDRLPVVLHYILEIVAGARCDAPPVFAVNDPALVVVHSIPEIVTEALGDHYTRRNRTLNNKETFRFE